MCDLTIILPCRDDVKLLSKVMKEVLSHVYLMNYTYELIVIDMGNNTKIKEMLKLLSTNYETIKVVQGVTDRGKAIKRGVRIAEGKYIFCLEEDIVTDLRAIEEALSYLITGTAEIILGTSYMRESPMYKQKSRLEVRVNKVISLGFDKLANVEAADMQCEFKAMTKEQGMQMRPIEFKGGIFATLCTWFFIIGRATPTVTIPILWHKKSIFDNHTFHKIDRVMQGIGKDEPGKLKDSNEDEKLFDYQFSVDKSDTEKYVYKPKRHNKATLQKERLMQSLKDNKLIVNGRKTCNKYKRTSSSMLNMFIESFVSTFNSIKKSINKRLR